MANAELNRIARAARLLADARRSGERLAALPEDCRPGSIEDAYAIQDEVARQLGEVIGGWKVGAMSPQHPSSIAPIYASSIIETPATLPAAKSALCGVEAEIAFRFRRDLFNKGSPYERDEVLAEVASAHPVIEVLESRFRDILAIDRRSATADNISNGYLIIGQEISEWRDSNLERPLIKVMNNGRLFILSIGNNGGDPFRLLTDLVNHVTASRGGLKGGTLVTTGTCTGIVFAEPGAEIVADFGKLGRVAVSFPLTR